MGDHTGSVYQNTFFDSLPNHKALIEFVDQKVLVSYEDLADSSRLQKIINRIISFILSYFDGRGTRQPFQSQYRSSHISSVSFWGLHAMTVRLNILKSALIYQLCIPQLYQMIGMGTIDSAIPTQSRSSEIQINYRNLVERAKAIMIETFTLFLVAEEKVAGDEEKEEEIHRRKSNLFFHLLEYKYCPIFPQVLTVKEDGKYLLELLTCYTLSITAICDALKQSIRNVVSSMIDVISDSDNRYPVSSNSSSGGKSLVLLYRPYIFPIIYDYLQWCQSHSEILVRDSRKDEIVMSVNSSLRASLRSEQYETPQDILRCFHRKYRDRLSRLLLPLQPYTIADIEQAKKDIKRETVAVNKVVYSPSTSLSAWTAMREEAKKVLVFLFGIDNPALLELSSVDLQCRTEREEAESPPSPSTEEEEEDREENGEGGDSFEETVPLRGLQSVQHYNWDLIQAINRHHYQTQSSSQSPSPSHPSSNNTSIASTDDASSLLSKQLLRRGRSRSSSERPASIVYGDLLEILHCHIVLAASRTIAAGDAFILLNDLFGGDGLVFCPVSQPRHSSSNNNCDISIALTTRAVKIVLKERYRLVSSEALELDLMFFECCTTTLLLLSPETYLSSEALKPSLSDARRLVVLEVNNFERAACLLNVLITDPGRVCQRAVSIEPYWPDP